MKPKNWILVHVDTNEPRKNYLGNKVLLYSTEKDAKAALINMNKKDQKNYMVEPNFDVYESEIKTFKTYINDLDEVASFRQRSLAMKLTKNSREKSRRDADTDQSDKEFIAQKALQQKWKKEFPNEKWPGYEKAIKDLNESKYDYIIRHKTFSSAVQHAIEMAEKRGYEVDEDEWDRKVALGPRKPSKGKTNIYSISLLKDGKPSRKMLHMQVYYDEGNYELNMYVS